MERVSRRNMVLTILSVVGLLMVWGNVPIIIQEVTGPETGLSGWQVAAGRLLPAAVLGLLVGLAVDAQRFASLWGLGPQGRDGPYGRWRPLIIVILSFGAYFLHTAVMALGKTYEVPAGTVALVVALVTPCTAILAWFTGTEHIGWRKVAGIAVAFAGLYVAVHFGAGEEISFRYMGAILLMLLSPLAGAFYMVFARPLIKQYGPLLVVSSMFVAAALPAVGYWFSTDVAMRLANLSGYHWALMLYLILLAHFGGQIIWLRALRVIEPSKLVMAIYAVPVITLIMDHLLGRRHLSWPLAAGAAVLLSGVALAGSARRREVRTGDAEAHESLEEARS